MEVEVEVGRECTDNDNVKNDIAMAGPERVCVSEGYGPAFLLERYEYAPHSQPSM